MENDLLTDEQIDEVRDWLILMDRNGNHHEQKLKALCAQAKLANRTPATADSGAVRVPREPTEAMRQAGCDAIQEHYRRDGGWCGLIAAQEQMLLVWRAMLLAAPPAPTSGRDEVFFYEREFYVLSNFSAFRLQWSGDSFDTSEAAYHWEKFRHRPDVRRQIQRADSAHEAFKLAERWKDQRRPDWDDVKVGIMRDIVRAKAEQHEYVRRKLLQTGDRELIEDSWRDDFWGWGPNRDGKNMLGKLWMEVRAELALKTTNDAAQAETSQGSSPEARDAGIGTGQPAAASPINDAASVEHRKQPASPSQEDDSRTQRSAASPAKLPSVPFIKMLRDQRDECADALRGLMPEGWDDGDMDHMPGIKAARLALANVPTYEQRLENILNGLAEIANNPPAPSPGMEMPEMPPIVEAEVGTLNQTFKLAYVAKKDYDALRQFAEGQARENAAIRALMNTYNLGGWTDAIAPMQRALAAEARLAVLESERQYHMNAINAVVGQGNRETVSRLEEPMTRSAAEKKVVRAALRWWRRHGCPKHSYVERYMTMQQRDLSRAVAALSRSRRKGK